MLISPEGNSEEPLECEECENVAIIFMCEIKDGKTTERRFCVQCAAKSDESVLKGLVARLKTRPDVAE